MWNVKWCPNWRSLVFLVHVRPLQNKTPKVWVFRVTGNLSVHKSALTYTQFNLRISCLDSITTWDFFCHFNVVSMTYFNPLQFPSPCRIDWWNEVTFVERTNLHNAWNCHVVWWNFRCKLINSIECVIFIVRGKFTRKIGTQFLIV